MFWNNVKVLLKKHNYTQKSFSSALGCPERTVEQWVYKNSIPDAETAYKIAQLLNTSVEYLVTGIEPEMKDTKDEVITAVEETLKRFK